MAVLGLVLVVVAVAFGTDIAVENTRAVSGKALGQTVTGWSLGGVFLAGAITALVLAVGLWLIFGGLARARRRRLAQRAALREREAQRETLAQENTRLAQALETQRTAEAATPAAPVSPYDESPG